MDNIVQLFGKTKAPRKARSHRSADPNRVTSGCRWYPRLKVYKGDHFWFDPQTLEARSYQWWSMLLKVGSRLVINECRYSNQTAKDFGKLHACLRRDGVTADVSIYCREGLNNLSESTVQAYQRGIERIEAAMAVKGSHKRKNEERREEIARIKEKITLARSLLKAKRATEKRAFVRLEA